ncbi:hypothetical protein BLA29_012590, partial [Euroglyphus maynei]
MQNYNNDGDNNDIIVENDFQKTSTAYASLSRAVIRRRRRHRPRQNSMNLRNSFISDRQKNVDNNIGMDNITDNNNNIQLQKSMTVVDIISKRLSLPADLHLPASFLAKIERELDRKPSQKQQQQQQQKRFDNDDRDDFITTLLSTDPNKTISRKVRRESLVSVFY